MKENYVHDTELKTALGRDSIREHSDGTRGNCFRWDEGRIKLDIRKKFFIMRAVRHWNRFPRKPVDASSLKVFKTRLDGGFEQPWAGNVPTHGRGGRTGQSLRFLPTQTIL